MRRRRRRVTINRVEEKDYRKKEAVKLGVEWHVATGAENKSIESRRQV